MPYRRSTPSPRKSFTAARIGTSAAAVVQLFLPLRQWRSRVNAPTELLLFRQVGKAGLSKDTLVVRHANFALRVQDAGRVDGHRQIALDTEAEIDVFGLDGFVPFIDFLGRMSAGQLLSYELYLELLRFDTLATVDLPDGASATGRNGRHPHDVEESIGLDDANRRVDVSKD
jgi:hypothetical protein